MSKKLKSDRTRAEILDVAWDLIAEKGADTSIADIAAAVGLTRQSIYVHFGSRGGLLMALVRRADERFEIWETFTQAIETEEPRDRLDACLRAWLAFVPKIYPVASDLIRLRAQDEEAAAAWEDRMSELREVFRHLVKGLQRDGVLADRWTAPKAADYLWAACSVQSWSLLVHDVGWSEKQAAETIRDAAARVLLD